MNVFKIQKLSEQENNEVQAMCGKKKPACVCLLAPPFSVYLALSAHYTSLFDVVSSSLVDTLDHKEIKGVRKTDCVIAGTESSMGRMSNWKRIHGRSCLPST